MAGEDGWHWQAESGGAENKEGPAPKRHEVLAVEQHAISRPYPARDAALILMRETRTDRFQDGNTASARNRSALVPGSGPLPRGMICRSLRARIPGRYASVRASL